MTDEKLKLPLYAKATILLVGLFTLVAILYLLKTIIVPLVFATIIAVLLHPLVNLFLRLKINRVIAISVTLLLTFLVLAGLFALIFMQFNRFIESWPVLIERFTSILNQTINEGAEYFNRDPEKIYAWIAKTQSEIINLSTAAIGQTLVIAGGLVVILFLLPVYIFLILFYQPLLLEFIHRIFGVSNHSQVAVIVSNIKTLIQRYLVGLFIEATIVAILDSTALLILGIDYAILLGIIGALLNVIPYIGGLVAVALPMIVALVTKSSPLYAVYIMIAYYIIQMIDNNFIVPYIVASKVKINALFSIIVVFAGNALWGIPGMFLAIPLLAIIKLIFDNIESLKPWGFLLGDTMPPILKIKRIFKSSKEKGS